MAISHTRFLVASVAIATAVFALIGSSTAQEGPAPAPASSAGVALPSLAAGCAVAVASFVFGSALRI